MNYGFVRVASSVPGVRVADIAYNCQCIIEQMQGASRQGVELLCFPELCITGYTCQDLFAQQTLLDEALAGLEQIRQASTQCPGMVSVVGLPIAAGGALLNCAAVVGSGTVSALVPKTYLPNYKEFYEKRWFTSGSDVPFGLQVALHDGPCPILQSHIFAHGHFTFGIEICEDVWSPIPPSSRMALSGADIILNLSADDDAVGKYTYLQQLLSQQSARCICGYVYSGCGYGESTQDVVFSGKALIYENGTLLAQGQRHSLQPQLVVTEVDVERLRSERRLNTTFATTAAIERRISGSCPTAMLQPDARTEYDQFPMLSLTRSVNPHPFVPTGRDLDDRCQEIFAIQTEGLARRIQHTHTQHVVLGISGGLDSTLALLVCVRTYDMLGMDRSGIVGITMPGFGTTDRTYNNAIQLMRRLGITIREISIAASVTQHFADIGHDASVHDVTYENCQARERTQILMDVANQVGGFVVGTGDLSELALGWATYNGDHMSMYGVNASVPKTLVRHLVRWVAGQLSDVQARDTLLDIIDTPISPELIPADENGQIRQKTEDLVGPYELHDFYLYYILRWGFRPAKIYQLALNAQFDEPYTPDVLLRWLRTFCWRFFAQQFKRSCLPDGPKVGSCSLSPRGDWRMPSDASSASWIDECKRLQEYFCPDKMK